MRKPVIQDIADSLSVSRISVWKALNNRPGISKGLREKILQKAKEAGLIDNSSEAADKTDINAPAWTVATVVSRPESSVFWMQIIHEIAEELSSRGINLMYTHMPAFYSENDTLPAGLRNGLISGIIVLNIYSEPQLRMLAELPIPKVFLDNVPSLPPEQLCGDLVLIEGRHAVRKITGKVLDSGLLKLGFVGDIQYAQTNMDRYMGYLDAYADRDIKHDPSLCLTGRLHLNLHYEEISRFLDSLSSMPDGFICASDYIAHFIQRYFTEHGIPDGKVFLSGFDNNAEYANVANRITTVDVQTRTMGRRLASKLLFKLSHPDSSREVSYVTSKIIYRP